MVTTLKITLDNKSKIFSPGAEITGIVDVKDIIRQSVTVPALTCRLVGTVHTFQHFVYHEMVEEHDVVKEELPLITASTRIEKTNRLIPFKLTIPEDAPPSVYVTSRNYINYRVEAYIPGSKTSNSTRNIYVVTKIPQKDLTWQTLQSTVQVPIASDDVLVRYGDGFYPATPRIAGTTIIEDAKKDDGAEVEQISVYNESVTDSNVSLHNPKLPRNVAKAPDGRPIFVHSEKYDSNITMVVDFLYPGLYTDEAVNVGVKLLIGGDLPAMTLQTLKITIVEYTKLKAKEMTNTHSRPYKLFKIEKPIDLTDKPVHDFSQKIIEEAKFPEAMAPNFNLPTMSRWYMMSVHIQIAKASVALEVTAQHENRLHLNARQNIECYGQSKNQFLLPIYSKQYA